MVGELKLPPPPGFWSPIQCPFIQVTEEKAAPKINNNGKGEMQIRLKNSPQETEKTLKKNQSVWPP